MDLDSKATGDKFVQHIENLDLTEGVELDLRCCYLDYDACSVVFETLLRRMCEKIPDGTNKRLTVFTHLDLGSANEMAAKLMRRSELLYDPQKHDREKLIQYCRTHNLEVVIRVSPHRPESKIEGRDYFLYGA